MKKIENDTFEIQFGEFIKQAREEKCLNQSEIAEKIGIGQPHLSLFEKGERVVSFKRALKICKALDIDIKEFIENYTE